ncbi:MAG: hypothetical protein K5640_03130 [Treponema sp.]|nr:hypothetical protein [Treponema sp.]
MGLLNKIENAAYNSKTFYNWAFTNGIEHAAVFQCISNKYVITHAKGIDAQTVLSSISSFDFFNGTILSFKKWLCTSAQTKAIEPYYQLLSGNYKDTVQKICFLPLTDSEKPPVLMLFSLENEELKLPDDNSENKEKILSYIEKTQDKTVEIPAQKINSLLPNQANLFIISLKLAFQQIYKNTIINEELKSITEKTLYNEFFNQLYSCLSEHNLCQRGSDFEIKAAVFSNAELELNLFQAFISELFMPLTGETYAEKIVTISAGKSENSESIQKFLTQS